MPPRTNDNVLVLTSQLSREEASGLLPPAARAEGSFASQCYGANVRGTRCW